MMRLTVQIWRELRHPHVVQFFGGSTVDDPPFLIMPFLRNGNVRRYLMKHPQANRLKLASEIALGLEYLHGRSPPIWCVKRP